MLLGRKGKEECCACRGEEDNKRETVFGIIIDIREVTILPYYYYARHPRTSPEALPGSYKKGTAALKKYRSDQAFMATTSGDESQPSEKKMTTPDAAGDI